MNRKISTLLCTAALLLLAPTSCIYEDEVPCPCDVRFVYDYNMEFADAFPRQVNDVRLYVFDSEGRFVTSLEDRGDHLDADYRMTLDLQPGTYRLVAWAGRDEDATPLADCYRLGPVGSQAGSTGTPEDIRMSLVCEGSTHDRPLADLWHGMAEAFTVSGDGPAHAVVPLVKDVNRFRVLLQAADGQPLAADDWSLTLRAANHRLDYDNSLLPCTPLDYLPYVKQTAYIENDAQAAPDTRDGTGTGISALVAELATLRLMEDGETRFTVRDERSGRDVFDIDLVRYLNLMRLDQYGDMPLQEYLDRENTWQVILLMGNTASGTPTMLSIQINAWRMVFNQTEL